MAKKNFSKELQTQAEAFISKPPEEAEGEGEAAVTKDAGEASTAKRAKGKASKKTEGATASVEAVTMKGDLAGGEASAGDIKAEAEAKIKQLEDMLAKAEQANREKDRELKAQAAALEAARRPREAKSKRINLLLRPSVFDGASKLASDKGYPSFNDFVDKILERVVEKKGDI